eukprot:TRINITY_DN1614_c0_g1_i1.p1 TRINITY_DN1614_c0_g1~~TRINITY_DN1614_c0_g1_i1.p1  ORF type:complete len:412 (-),score=92.01 TRINITY_DN1614_c0_g1_i1:227-1462(-)
MHSARYPLPLEEIETDWDSFDEHFYEKDGCQYTRPYYFQYRSNVKGRWVDKTVLQVLCEEFGERNRDYFVEHIESQDVLINNKPTTVDTRMKLGMQMVHRVLKREIPVLAKEKPIVLGMFENVVAFYKPASYPCHAVGRYFKNTLAGWYELRATKIPSMPRPFFINRLDKVTSGVILCAKDGKTADDYRIKFRDKGMAKLYLALVAGEFPEGIQFNDGNLKSFNDPKKPCVVDPSGKESITLFERVASFDTKDFDNFDPCSSGLVASGVESNDLPEKISLVKCWPLTGRMHQIRLHLKDLGFPIANDSLYNDVIPIDRENELSWFFVFLHSLCYSTMDLMMNDVFMDVVQERIDGVVNCRYSEYSELCFVSPLPDWVQRFGISYSDIGSFAPDIELLNECLTKLRSSTNDS